MKTLLIDIDDTLYKHTSPIQMMNYNNINEDKVLTEALNKTIEWNNLIKNGASERIICEKQFLIYIRNKK